MTTGFRYENMTLRPALGQFVIENGSLLILTPMVGIAAVFFPTPYRWILIALTAITVAYLLYRHEYISSMKYHVGEEQLMIQHGVMSLRRDYVEMYRIVDYDETRSVLERLFGIKTVTVYSGDKTAPELKIRGVKNSLDLVSAIRERVEYNKQRKGVREITNL